MTGGVGRCSTDAPRPTVSAPDPADVPKRGRFAPLAPEVAEPPQGPPPPRPKIPPHLAKSVPSTSFTARDAGGHVDHHGSRLSHLLVAVAAHPDGGQPLTSRQPDKREDVATSVSNAPGTAPTATAGAAATGSGDATAATRPGGARKRRGSDAGQSGQKNPEGGEIAGRTGKRPIPAEPSEDATIAVKGRRAGGPKGHAGQGRAGRSDRTDGQPVAQSRGGSIVRTGLAAPAGDHRGLDEKQSMTLFGAR